MIWEIIAIGFLIIVVFHIYNGLKIHGFINDADQGESVK